MKRVLLTLFVFLLAVSWQPRQMLHAQVIGDSITFDWIIPVERTDGTALLNLAGFRVYQSAQAGVYQVNPVSDINNPGIATYVLDGVGEGLWYFVVTAYDAAGLESDHSNEVSMTIVGIPSPPKAPAAFRVVST